MPITGQESELSSQLQSAIRTAFETEYGAAGAPDYLDALCNGIANAIIPFLVNNVQVNPGQVVPGDGLLDSLNKPVTGDSATSTTTTIS